MRLQLVKHKQTCYSIGPVNGYLNLKERMFQNCQSVIIKGLLIGVFKFGVVKCGNLTHSKLLLVIK